MGVLYIIGTVAGALSWAATAGLLDGPDYLAPAAAHASRLRLGALLVLLMGFALAMVAVLLFPILKRYSEPLALGYVVLRGALETATYLAVAACWLMLVVAAQQPAPSGSPLAVKFAGVGTLLVGASAGPLSALKSVVFSLGALILYYVMHQSKIIPRWLSGWGSSVPASNWPSA